MSGTWEHNDAECQWELVRYRTDDIRDTRTRHVGLIVTDEAIDGVADPARMAVRLFNRWGTVPPPLDALLPPHDHNTVRYEP